ncbi:MAG: sigma-70 family RNA polymerase sigma factor [Bacteroidales bacterium]|nr:sigma-70 family RNA polymerase sigma factor [Bacteroidales bacterium]MDD4685227.1 sigma-70 family RNA polymerase sigma factor [Bacteroidales bacterium]
MDLDKIIEGCKKGNPKAQKALYDMFSDKLFGVCLRYCRSREDAQDVFQDAFVKVFNSLDKYKPFGSFDAWLKRIFINQALNFYRYDKSFSHVSADDVQIPSDEIDNESFYDKFSNQMILDSVQKLANRQRIIFNMVEIEGCSYEEVANMLEVTQECIRTQNFKAKRKLRTLLSDLADKD